MNLYRMLAGLAEENRPVRVGLIGAGKFGTMYLAQVRTTTGVHLTGLADLDPGGKVPSCDSRLGAGAMECTVDE